MGRVSTVSARAPQTAAFIDSPSGNFTMVEPSEPRGRFVEFDGDDGDDGVRFRFWAATRRQRRTSLSLLTHLRGPLQSLGAHYQESHPALNRPTHFQAPVRQYVHAVVHWL